MAKELRFLQVGELRDKSNFIGNIEELVQVPVSHKDTVKEINKRIGKYIDQGDSEAAFAYEDYLWSTEIPEDPKTKFFEVIDIIPAEGINMYAIFELRKT